MDINDGSQKCYPNSEDASGFPSVPIIPTCANCDFFEPCNPEHCKEPDEDPHGFCYVEPPKYIQGGGARGVQTWANNRACRYHPHHLGSSSRVVLEAIAEVTTRLREFEEEGVIED